MALLCSYVYVHAAQDDTFSSIIHTVSRGAWWKILEFGLMMELSMHALGWLGCLLPQENFITCSEIASEAIFVTQMPLVQPGYITGVIPPFAMIHVSHQEAFQHIVVDHVQEKFLLVLKPVQ